MIVVLRRWANVIQARPDGLLFGVLCLLPVVAWEGPDSVAGRTWWLVSIGLFLLWQPVVNPDRRLSWGSTAVAFAGLSMLAVKLDWFWFAVWGLVLASLVAGQMMGVRAVRRGWFYLLCFAYLVLFLLLWASPQLFLVSSGDGESWLRYFTLVPLVGAFLTGPWRQSHERRGAYDFLVSLLVFLLLAFVLMRTQALVVIYGRSHLEALTQSTLALGGLVLVLAWAWNPRPGFSGLGQLFSRYFLRLGIPFDDWLKAVSQAFDSAVDAESFAKEAFDAFLQLPWVTGGRATINEQLDYSFGTGGRHRTVLAAPGMQLELYTAYRWNSALAWQGRLLLKLVRDFYRARQRAQSLEDLRYLQAIHETGSRVAHDVKNVLQSLETVCAVATHPPQGTADAELVSLLRRQIPAVTQRLRQTMRSLGSVPAFEGPVWGMVQNWWSGAIERYAGADISWRMKVDDSIQVPVDLFDHVLDQLLSNALAKGAGSSGPGPKVFLTAENDHVALFVEDAGDPIPDALVSQLFQRPAPSETGFGVGLYLSSRWADRIGYRLSLDDNKQGCVRFALRKLEPTKN